ncbi:MAG: cupin domain-containing protein [Solirubrobacterales bacterium]
MADSTIQTTTLSPDGEVFRPLRRELGVSSFGINLITLEPRQRQRVHIHQRQEEVYVVVEGELTLIVEEVEHRLPRGTVAGVAPEQRRQLTNPSDQRVVVLCLGGSGEHESRDALAWGSWDEEGEGRSPRDVPLPPDL